MATDDPQYLWLNGQLVPWGQATVHITDVGWTAVSAVFEGIRAYRDATKDYVHLFRLNDHLKRFGDSMKLMRMDPQCTLEELGQAITQLLIANGTSDDTYIQPLAFFGGAVPGYRAIEEPQTNILITARPSPSNLGTERALHACISSWVRLADSAMPMRAKGIANYQNSRLAATEARINGYDTAIILNNRGKVAEAPAACIFLVRDGVVITPNVTADILESITRSTLIQLCHEVLAVPVLEREVDRTELYIADEVFLCGTLSEITPIISMDRYVVGAGKTGPVTRRLETLYHDIVRARNDSYSHWLTTVRTV